MAGMHMKVFITYQKNVNQIKMTGIISHHQKDIKKTGNQCWQDVGMEKKIIFTVVEMPCGSAFKEKTVETSQKSKIKLS